MLVAVIAIVLYILALLTVGRLNKGHIWVDAIGQATSCLWEYVVRCY